MTHQVQRHEVQAELRQRSRAAAVDSQEDGQPASSTRIPSVMTQAFHYAQRRVSCAAARKCSSQCLEYQCNFEAHPGSM